MNRYFHKLLFICATCVFCLQACKKDDFKPLTEPPVGLGGNVFVKDSIDHFIYDSLTRPYNVAVYYRWDPTKFSTDYNVLPPDRSKVIPMLQGITRVAFPPYNEITGSTVFLKKYLPKFFYLAGTPQFNPNGTITLGQAEGGTKITYFEVDKFSSRVQDSAILKRILHTMHHEFAHVLHQNVMFPDSYQSITGGYTGSWFNYSNVQARQMGFITAYAMAGEQEDFVEMISSMLVGADNGPSGGFDNYEQLLRQADTAANPTAVPYLKIKAKEAMVVQYFKDVWNIDFYQLQAICRQRLKAYYNQ